MAKKNSTKTVPELRFRGFTDPWEQRQLGEVAEIVGGGTPDSSNADYWDGNIDWYTPSEIGASRTVETSARKITHEGLDHSSARLLPAGSILFTSRASIGLMAFISRPSATNQGFQSLIPNASINPDFLYALGPYISRYARKHAAGSTFVEISGSSLAKTPMRIPSLPEQHRIGDFFSALDLLIAAAERQEALLRRKKQAYLQLMFPQEGETEPRLRFAEFSGEWEQRQLGDVAEITIGQSPEGRYSNDNQEGVALAQGNTDIVNGVFVPRVWTKRPTKIVPAGTFLVSVRAPVGDVAVTPIQACIGRGFAGILGNSFLRYSLERLKTSGHWDRVSSGSVLDAITSKELLQTPISIASNQEEQCIGEFFTRLDHLIEIVERQVATLETMKRAYLQRMFV